jgi:hypothetical protein
MGTNRHFSKIKFLPFKSRIGDIAVTNFYINDKGVPKPLQDHLKYNPFSFFEIIKFEKNIYYGREQEYIDNGYIESFGGDFLQNGHHSIQRSFFVKPESAYMLAHWDRMDHDEYIPDLVFCGSRPLDLTPEEQSIFMQLAKEGQEHIEKILKDSDFYEDETY